VHLAINGDYVGSAEIAFDDAGDVAVGTAFLGESFQEDAVTEFEDFTVWSDEGGRSTPEDEDQESPDDPDSDQGQNPDNDQDSPPAGNRYDAEVFTFHFTYSNAWLLGEPVPLDGLEVIPLSSENSAVQVIVGNVWDDQQSCIEALLGTVLTNFENNDVTGEVESDGIVESTESPFDGTFQIEVLFVPDESLDIAPSVIYVECGPAGTNEYLVGVVQVASVNVYEAEAELRKDLVATFNAEEAAEPDPDGGNSTNQPVGTQLSANVTEDEDGNRFYLSPTFGFIVGILPGFTIEEDSVASGYDTLVIADEVSRVTVSGFASSNTPRGCLDSILNNLNNDPSITEVQIALDTEGEEFRYEDDMQAEFAVYLTFNTAGGPLDLGRYYACFSNDAHTSMLVVAYETQADVFPDEFENVDTMLSLIRVP
jgi:hypothetical protein